VTVDSNLQGGITSEGSIYDTFPTLDLTDSVISGNMIRGLFNGVDSTTEIRGSIIKDNAGPGIDSIGSLNVTNSTIEGNIAPGGGGGMLLAGTATLTGVTISANEGTPGGGIYSGSGTFVLRNSTITGNYAPSQLGPLGRVPGTGGGIRHISGELVLDSVTIANNRADDEGAGIHHIVAGTVRLHNTIVAANLGNDGVENCFGPIESAGYNLEDADSCQLTMPSDHINIDPLFEPLGDYGGPTQTLALRSNSPAIDSGDFGQCPPVDQRGQTRPVDGDGDGQAVCDIGAFEAQQPPPPTPTPAPTATPASTPAALPPTGRGAPSTGTQGSAQNAAILSALLALTLGAVNRLKKGGRT